MRWGMLCVLLLCMLPVSATLTAQELGISTNNIARIADFTNDGQLDILAFADRIDTRFTPIQLYTRNGQTFTLHQDLTNLSLARCALSYYDINRNGYLDIVYQCFDDTNTIHSGILSFNATTQSFHTLIPWSPNPTTNITTASYGDLVVTDLTGNGYGDIISCLSVHDNELALFTFGPNGDMISHPSGIPLERVTTNGVIAGCYITFADLDGDGDADLLIHTYNDNQITFYQNNFCTHTQCTYPATFTPFTDPTLFNETLFQGQLKHAQLFAGQQNLPDLSLVYDAGPSDIAGARSIRFVHYPHQSRNLSFNPPLPPTITANATITSGIQLSWMDIPSLPYTHHISLQNASFTTISRNHTYLTYALQLTSSTGALLLSGEMASSNYDIQVRAGNLLNRNPFNYRSANQQCLFAQARSISPSLSVSQWSPPTPIQPLLVYTNGVTSSFELCDGLDTTCDGIPDGPFTLTWPDGIQTNHTGWQSITTQSPRFQTITHPTNASMFITVDCQPRISRLAPPTPSFHNDATSSGGGSFTAEQQPTQPGQPEESTPLPPDTDQEPDPDPQPPQPPSSSAPGVFQPIPGFDITWSVTHIGQTTRVVQTIRNTERTKKTDLILRLEFPQHILSQASDLHTRHRHTIIRNNPIIDFFLSDLDYLSTTNVMYTLPSIITTTQLEDITMSITSTPLIPQDQLDQLEQQQQANAQQSLRTNLTETRIGNQTKITIDIDLNEDIQRVGGIEIEQEIPKCLIPFITDEILRASIDPILLDSVEIKQADPVLVWRVERLDQARQLTMMLDAFRDEDCDDEIKLTILARDFISASQPIDTHDLINALLLTLAIIVIFGTLAIIASHDFSTQRPPHIQRLIKIINKRRHNSQDDATITQHLLTNQEQPQDIQEAFAHLNATPSWYIHLMRHSLEIVLFITLAILSILELSGLLPGYINYTKKLISIILMLFILYKASPSLLLFNVHKKHWDMALLGGMLLLYLKNLVIFADRGLDSGIGFVFSLYLWIARNPIYFTTYALIIGLGIITVCALLATRYPVRHNSLLHICTSIRIPATLSQYVRRFTLLEVILLIFFFSLVNRFLEWLAIAIDSAVFVTTATALLIVLFATSIHLRRNNTIAVLVHIILRNLLLISLIGIIALAVLRPFIPIMGTIWIGIFATLAIMLIIIIIKETRVHFQDIEHLMTTTDTFYEKYLRLFKHPMTLPLAIAGLFVLQLIVEIGLYIIPNITGHTSSIYTITGTKTLFSLLGEQGIVASHLYTLPPTLSLFYGIFYTAALIGFLLLLLLPIIIWMVHFTNRNNHPTHISLGQALMHSTFSTITKMYILLGIPLMTIAMVSGTITITTISDFSLHQAAGVFIDVSKTTLPAETIIILLSFAAIYLLIASLLMHWKPTRTALIYLTCWSGMTLLTIIYIIPYLSSLLHYIIYLWQLPGAFTTTLINQFIAVFLIIDITLVYGMGSIILAFYILPRQQRKYILHLITSHHLFHRYFYAANSMQLLEYYDQARLQVSGNIVHHLEHYARRQLQQGHHLETILLQMHIHDYPQPIIDQAIQGLSKDHHVIETLLHTNRPTFDTKRVQKLTRILKKRWTLQPFKDIYAQYESEYGYTEIILAYRFASKKIKGSITLEHIEQDELANLNTIIEQVEHLKHLQPPTILARLTAQGYDPEIIQQGITTLTPQTIRFTHIEQLLPIIQHLHIKPNRLHELLTLTTKGYSQLEILYALSIIIDHHHPITTYEKHIIRQAATYAMHNTNSQLIQQFIARGWDEHAALALITNAKLLLESSTYDRYMVHFLRSANYHPSKEFILND